MNEVYYHYPVHECQEHTACCRTQTPTCNHGEWNSSKMLSAGAGAPEPTKGLSHNQAVLCFSAVQQIRSAACCPAAGLNSSMSCTQCLSLARTPRCGSARCRRRTPSRFCFWKQMAEQGTVTAVCREVGMSFGVPVWFWWLLVPSCLRGPRNL